MFRVLFLVLRGFCVWMRAKFVRCVEFLKGDPPILSFCSFPGEMMLESCSKVG